MEGTSVERERKRLSGKRKLVGSGREEIEKKKARERREKM